MYNSSTNSMYNNGTTNQSFFPSQPPYVPLSNNFNNSQNLNIQPFPFVNNSNTVNNPPNPTLLQPLLPQPSNFLSSSSAQPNFNQRPPIPSNVMVRPQQQRPVSSSGFDFNFGNHPVNTSQNFYGNLPLQRTTQSFAPLEPPPNPTVAQQMDIQKMSKQMEELQKAQQNTTQNLLQFVNQFKNQIDTLSGFELENRKLRGEELHLCSTEELRKLKSTLDHSLEMCKILILKREKESNVINLEEEDDEATSKDSCQNGIECCICWTNSCNIVLFPCKHLCMCKGCLDSLQAKHLKERKEFQCPKCRSSVQQHIQIFT